MDFKVPAKKHINQLKCLFSQLTGKEVIEIDIKAMQNTESSYLVMEEGGEAIGFGALIIYHLPTTGKVGKIEDIIIDEKYRGQGLGRKLIEKLLNVAREKNVRKIQLTSSPKRIEARTLYQSLGFVIKDTNVFIKEL